MRSCDSATSTGTCSSTCTWRASVVLSTFVVAQAAASLHATAGRDNLALAAVVLTAMGPFLWVEHFLLRALLRSLWSALLVAHCDCTCRPTGACLHLLTGPHTHLAQCGCVWGCVSLKQARGYEVAQHCTSPGTWCKILRIFKHHHPHRPKASTQELGTVRRRDGRSLLDHFAYLGI